MSNVTGTVKLRRRLDALKKAAQAGDVGAAGEARLLEQWLDDEGAVLQKRQDDRCKVLVGALVGHLLSEGRELHIGDQRALLDALDGFLVRPGERDAVLADGGGSDAFHRVFGKP